MYEYKEYYILYVVLTRINGRNRWFLYEFVIETEQMLCSTPSKATLIVELCKVIAHHRLYRLFAAQLFNEIQGAVFSHGLSFNKDGLLLHFYQGKQEICYEVKFVEGALLITKANWTDSRSKVKSNAVLQLKELEGHVVVDVRYGLFDRVFAVEFQNGSRLLFKSFGKFGNVLLYEQDHTIPDHIFRFNFKKDWELNWADIATTWQSFKSGRIALPNLENPDQWKSMIKGIGVEEVLENYPDFFEQDVSNKENSIYSLSNHLRYLPQLIIEGEKAVINWIKRPLMSLDYVLNELETELRSYLRWYFFEREKILLLAESGRQLKSIRNRLKTYQTRKSEMSNQRSFKEIGDLILGHAHSIRKGTSEALITDFFTGQRIRLKINPDLSAAENAEKCYKKAKNQGLEIAHLDENIVDLTKQLQVWENIESEAQKATSPKELRAYREFVPQLKGGGQKSIENQKPYKRLQYLGVEVWLGKNAKSNDALLKDAHKNDIWMHAADVSGSHVIIRNMGKPVAKNILEAVASYCAFNSKGKSQTLQTVMYTERKMVSKAKNGLPGQVKVAKFQTLDVEPKNLSDFS